MLDSSGANNFTRCSSMSIDAHSSHGAHIFHWHHSHIVEGLMASGGLVWEKITADWLADKPAEQSELSLYFRRKIEKEKQ